MKLPGHLVLSPVSVHGRAESELSISFYFAAARRYGSQYIAIEVERGTGEKYKVLPGAFNFI